jgi:diguanylate cyclase (GGDEF)-like protein
VRVLAQQKLKEMLEEKERLSITDDLTRLRNRRHVLEQLEAEINRSRRYSSPLSLIMLDVDRFKEINDEYGHLFGDEALVTIADILRGELRDTDTVARYGGDEFLIVLPETDLPRARTLAERILHLVADRAVVLAPDNPHPLTVSIGIAELRGESDSSKTLIHRADEGLLAAKNAGRNTVVAIEENSSLLSFE